MKDTTPRPDTTVGLSDFHTRKRVTLLRKGHGLEKPLGHYPACVDDARVMVRGADAVPGAAT